MTSDEVLTDAEIAGFMNWRGPGAYTAHAMRRVRAAIDEAVKREREACLEDVRTVGGQLSVECEALMRKRWGAA